MLEKLLDLYRRSFEITENYTIGDVVYDAYGYCNITNAKYVLVKKAELWRTLCFEHIFFRETEELTSSQIDAFCRHVEGFIEPELIRKGEKYPEKDHMYSYVTGIFISKNALSPEITQVVEKTRFMKNYLATIRGYTEMRILAVSPGRNTAAGGWEIPVIVGNRAAGELVKEYGSLLYGEQK